MKLLMTNRWSKVPNTEVVGSALAFVKLPNVMVRIRFGSLASGKSSGVLMPVAERVARSSEGAIVTPPRPVPKMNSLISVGLKLCVSVNRIAPVESDAAKLLARNQVGALARFGLD